jgi:hypothetical protein
MILARHSLDRPAHQQVADEQGDCAQCWHDTALAAVDAAATLLPRCWPLPEMDSSGLVTGPVIDWLLRRIDSVLECEQADRRDLDG